ncbi:oxidoreductase [Microbacterium sp. cx-55]|uniref:NAD-dependent epimerase/dehydratase family protein n=1 Tax=Microbacterium sp. cx-55 TaxID=2875948 RepID=UPI001CBB7D83|nr:NAD-dependent epimerase/dehydratase family protein [Microbacterium sp. cx-55]MBZ4485850.1 oxidoreductase [Microbacterium sp. cx-55]UGB34273.1 oxidoreductase [Microbacterium sp. cx-55]
MKLLVLGGTAWLGRTTAQHAIRAGHDVTCAARGTDIPAGARRVHVDRDLTDALAPLLDESWDAVIDVAREPGHVRRATRHLADRAAHYVFVSTCNVYADQSAIGADEDAELLAPLPADEMASPEDYGAAKVAGEDAVQAAFAGRHSIVRAGLIGGPGDPTGRSTYWPRRFARPATDDDAVLVPDAADLPTAIIDVRDLAGWLVHLAERRIVGAFDAGGEPHPFPHHIDVARGVSGHTGPLISRDGEWLVARGVAEWAGPRSLPLWLRDHDWYGMNARSSARAMSAGLVRRPLAETLADVRDGEITAGAGLTDDEQRELLALRPAH